MFPTRKTNNALKVALQEGHISGRDCHICSSAHRDANIGLSKRRRIIDFVAYQRPGAHRPRPSPAHVGLRTAPEYQLAQSAAFVFNLRHRAHMKPKEEETIMTLIRRARGVAAPFARLALLGLVLAIAPERTCAEVIDDDAHAFEKSAVATTPAEHEALVSYFKRKADEFGKLVELHKKMLAAAMNGRNYSAVEMHCKRIIAADEEAQQAYQGLAAVHAKLAKEASK